MWAISTNLFLSNHLQKLAEIQRSHHLAGRLRDPRNFNRFPFIKYNWPPCTVGRWADVAVWQMKLFLRSVLSPKTEQLRSQSGSFGLKIDLIMSLFASDLKWTPNLELKLLVLVAMKRGKTKAMLKTIYSSRASAYFSTIWNSQIIDKKNYVEDVKHPAKHWKMFETLCHICYLPEHLGYGPSWSAQRPRTPPAI